MSRKGNCYKASVAVAEAKKFGNVNGFDAAAEAKKFEAARATLAADSKCAIPPPVVALADWVLIKESPAIRARFK